MTDLEGLLAVQEQDTRIDQLHHRLAHLPERAAVAAADDALARLDRERAELDARRGVVAREQRRLEDEVASIEAKAAHVDDQLYGGTVTSPKELEALQHELEGLRARQRDLEDRVIEQMEAAEPIDEELARLEERRAASESGRTVATAELDSAVSSVESELADATDRRRDAAEGLPPDLLAAYDAIRAGADGIGAARLEGTRCLGCHLSIPSAQAEALRRAPADEVVHCPECGRILVR